MANITFELQIMSFIIDMFVISLFIGKICIVSKNNLNFFLFIRVKREDKSTVQASPLSSIRQKRPNWKLTWKNDSSLILQYDFSYTSNSFQRIKSQKFVLIQLFIKKLVKRLQTKSCQKVKQKHCLSSFQKQRVNFQIKQIKLNIGIYREKEVVWTKKKLKIFNFINFERLSFIKQYWTLMVGKIFIFIYIIFPSNVWLWGEYELNLNLSQF